MPAHILVDILGLNFQEEGVCIRVKELAVFSILLFQLVVIEVVHEVFGEI